MTLTDILGSRPTVSEILNPPTEVVQARAPIDIIHCRGAMAEFASSASKEWKQGEPVEFMYMPAGRHTVCAGFRGHAIVLTVQVDPQTVAKVLQGSLEQLRASAPRQLPFGCIEHEEKDAAVWAQSFSSREDGVYLTAEPSALGVHNVNGRIHRSWSPSFLSDADYSKAVLEDGIYTFPEGVRGSESNPARITGCAFCVGTLTNKPAFREMAPVKAKEAVQLDTVQAAGTSAGIIKGWIHRRTGVAVESDQAHKLSSVASQSDSPDDHAKAQVAHEKASTANLELAAAEIASAAEKSLHELISSQHTKQARLHEDAIKRLHKAKATDATPSEAVKAEEVPLGVDIPNKQAEAIQESMALDVTSLLSLQASLQVAHWNASTLLNDHEALGELYDAIAELSDKFVEAYCGAKHEWVKVGELHSCGSTLTEVLDCGIEAVKSLRSGLSEESDASLLNILADMDGAINKARFILKAKDATTPETICPVAGVSGSPAV